MQLSLTQNGRVPLNGELLKRLRAKLCLSQEALVERMADKRLSVSLASIKRAEAGKNVLFRIANNLSIFFDLPVQGLIEISATAQNTHAKDVRVGEENVDEGTQVTLLLQCRYASDFEKLLAELKKDFPSSELSMDGEKLQCQLTLALHSYLGDDICKLLALWTRLKTQYDEDLKACIALLLSAEINSRRSGQHPQQALLVDGHWGAIIACPNISQSGFCLPEYSANLMLETSSRYQKVSVLSNAGRYVGRNAELAWLEILYKNCGSQKRSEVIYVHGMAGIGKTRLLGEFFGHLTQRYQGRLLERPFEKNLIYIKTHAHCLLRDITLQLLGLEAGVEDATVRQYVATLSLADISPVAVLFLSGVVLLPAERRQLKPECDEGKIKSLTLIKLLQLFTREYPFAIAVDDLHQANNSNVDNLKMLIEHLSCLGRNNRPGVLLLLSSRNTGMFTSPPAWLEPALQLPLRGLNEEDAESMAKSVMPTTGNAHVISSAIRRAVDGAKGNPRFLLQMLFNPQPSVPDILTQMVEALMSSLAPVHQLTLKIAALWGDGFDEAQLRFCIKSYHIDCQECQPLFLVKLGLFKSSADRYRFQHPLIQQAVTKNITRFEERRFRLLRTDWQGISDSAVSEGRVYKY